MRITVVLDCRDPDALVPFWVEALGYRLVESLGHYRVLAPAEQGAGGPVFVLQQVSEPRQGKNRMHVDVHPADAEAHVERLLALGATRAGEPVTEWGMWWQVLADPEGNEFCVVAHPEPAAEQ